MLHTYYQRLADMAKHEEDLGKSHSLEEAQARHRVKHSAQKKATS